MDPLKKIFSENLQSLMEEKIITGKELAESLGVCETVVSRWKNGNSVPQWDNMVRLSEILDVPLTRLLSRAGEDRPDSDPQQPQFSFAEIAKCLDGGEGDMCKRCKVVRCRLVQKNTVNCLQCVRRNDCMKCLRQNKPKGYTFSSMKGKSNHDQSKPITTKH